MERNKHPSTLKGLKLSQRVIAWSPQWLSKASRWHREPNRRVAAGLRTFKPMTTATSSTDSTAKVWNISRVPEKNKLQQWFYKVLWCFMLLVPATYANIPLAAWTLWPGSNPRWLLSNRALVAQSQSSLPIVPHNCPVQVQTEWVNPCNFTISEQYFTIFPYISAMLYHNGTLNYPKLPYHSLICP